MPPTNEFCIKAYVCGEKSGLIMETPYRMGETLNGTTGLDINHEKKFVQEKLDQLRASGASPETVTQAMKDLGLRRFIFLLIYIYLLCCK